MTGCSSGDPDVTHEGQVSYACALAAHVAEQDPDMAAWTMIGDDADPMVREILAMGSLAGGSAGFELDEHAELSDAGKAVFEGVSRIDFDTMQTGLDDFDAACDSLSVSAEGDVSDEGQIRFGCDLAAHVVEEHGPAESWGSLGEEHAWHEVMSVGALFGAPIGQELADYPDISAAGRDLYMAVSTLDTQALDGGLEAVVDECEQL
ncbi:hypothetical protein NF556_06250 [Ornithinimicrobium faecis]|uniref:Uncharacterized protein n=1 Tax=Ornithinimicrobium faecis TaxID=2934158 RepID=A0ABY4YWW3_9MICO|nr:hypothetical protein [Ornithinimicrobium sp. HY1793]USQ81241.1 hypothetical protein NF556_06250 [Ornithinimicrobium sp. HY1793]